MKKLAPILLLAAFSLPTVAATPDAVVDHYADLAHAKYGDALTSATSMRMAIETLLAEPARPGSTPATLTSRPRSTASATPSSTTGRAR